MKKVNFDNYSQEYNSILESQLNFFDSDNDYFAEYKVLKVKNSLTTKPKKILDFGCGIGRSSVFLQQHFPESQVYGCDVSEKSLAMAKELVPSGQFFMMDELQATNHKFDLIFIAGVFHHIEPSQRQAVLKTIVNVSQDGTGIFVFEHNPLNPVTRYLVKICPFDTDAVLLKAKEMKKLFHQAGLKNIDCDYTLFFPEKLKWFRFLEKYLRFIPLGGQYVVSGTL